jgi:hypothetical protein
MKLKLFSLFILLGYLHSYSCSIYKITMGGKTLVGYNVDNWNANTRIWFEKGKATEYGSLFSGMDNLYPQAGMNEKGLMFGGLNVEQHSTLKKKHLLKFNGRLVMREIMKTCQNVDEVYKILCKYDRTPISDGILYFVDKTGDYLIVELDTMVKGNKSDYLLSNFCPSRIRDLDSVKIPFFQKGRKIMSTRIDTSFTYLKSLSDTLHQTYQKNLGGTLYTIIYDLNEASFNLFFYHDYSYSLKFNLREELVKNDTIIMIPTLFPNNENGQNQLKQYNKAKAFIGLLKETDIAVDSLKMTNYIKAEGIEPFFEFFEMDIIRAGYNLLNQKKTHAAIRVFKFNEKYNPRSGYSYSNLGNAYMQSGNYSTAMLYYKRSLEYNPGNKNAIKAIKKINRYLNR